MEWKLFADIADVAGDRHVTVDVGPDATVGDALDALLTARPSLEDRVLADDGTLQEHVNVLKNGGDVAAEDGLETPVEEGDELALFPPVSGGLPLRARAYR